MTIRVGSHALSCLRKYWKRETKAWGWSLDLVLFPVEVLYRTCVRLRLFFYKVKILKSHELLVPVISVGNIAIGGTGKTPFSRWLFETMREMGFTPGLISGKVGRDEHMLHKVWNPDGLFIIGRSKVTEAKLAAVRGANVVILDDGFQHLGLARNIDVVLVSAEHEGLTKCFPRGLFREPLSSISRADMVIVSRKTASRSRAQKVVQKIAEFVPEERIGQINLGFSCWKNIGGDKIEEPNGRKLVVTSIAEPECLMELVSANTGETPEMEIYRDHHEFTRSELESLSLRAKGYKVVTTEKDAVKLKEFPGILDNVYVLCLELKWEVGEHQMIDILRNLKERSQ
jgi:tetraacyldisaccharide 4'-kinase